MLVSECCVWIVYMGCVCVWYGCVCMWCLWGDRECAMYDGVCVVWLCVVYMLCVCGMCVWSVVCLWGD